MGRPESHTWSFSSRASKIGPEEFSGTQTSCRWVGSMLSHARYCET